MITWQPMIIFKKFILSLVLISFSNSALANCNVIKYIFDLGSGGIKVSAYLVDNRNKKICKTVMNSYLNLPFQSYISKSKDGKTISQSCIDETRKQLYELKASNNIDCRKHECLGFATAWARNSKNADSLIEEFKKAGINTTILSQYDEGKISVLSSLTEGNIHKEEEDSIVVFDIGGGSFQLSDIDQNGKIHVYHGPYGMFNFKSLVLKKFSSSGDEIISANNLLALKKFAIQTISDDLNNNHRLLKKLSEEKYIKTFGVGAFMSKAIKTQLNLGSVISINDVENAIDKLVGKTIIQIQHIYPSMPAEFAQNAQYSLLIIYSVMKEIGIKEIIITSDEGNTRYLALYGLKNIAS